MRIRPARRIKGLLRVPGDKSISHRAALITAIATGTSTITNFATGADCAATVACLKELGVAITEKELGVAITEKHRDLIVKGVGRNGLTPPSHTLDCGNSGTTMRLLAGVLAGQSFTTSLSGDESLRARPMRRVIEPLELMGASVKSHAGKPPMTVAGSRSLKGIEYALAIASAQVKSCILMAALNASGQTKISECVNQSRDHTERMLQWFEAPVSVQASADRYLTTVDGPVDLRAHDVSVPGDVSSAAYFIAAAALLRDSDLQVEDVGLNQTRTGFLPVFRSVGLDVRVSNESERCNEPLGTIHVLGQRQTLPVKTTLSGPAMAQLIDELPLLAVLGSQTPAGIEIRDAEELRLKESDRITATVRNLRAMGATVREFDDGMVVSPAQLRGTRIDTCGDHRIAMAFTVAALIADGESEFDDTECVGVSFPEFFELLESIVER
jgi:3-phosphoshikimate 1-carboxyvinyltransferase